MAFFDDFNVQVSESPFIKGTLYHSCDMIAMQEVREGEEETRQLRQAISQRGRHLLTIIEANPGIKTSDMAKKLSVSNATVKRMLDSLLSAKLIERLGIGPGSYYTLL